MGYINRPGSVPSLILAILVIAAGTNCAGSSVWTDAGDGFLSGEPAGTVVEDGTVVLDTGNVPEGNWVETMGWDGPPARLDHAMTFDSRSGLVVTFGGRTGARSSETWAYDLRTNTWTDMGPPSAPPPRASSMAFDERCGVSVLYGGRGDQGVINDTWIYNASANSWTDITTGQNPGAREGHKLVYDAAGGVVLLFGGAADWGGRLNDTWSLDTGTGKWTRLDCTGAPSPRHHFGMAYDRAAGEVIVHGGEGAGVSNDTWAFNRSTNAWRRLDATGPPSTRAYHELAYDGENRVVVLFGGEGEDAHWGDGLDDTWVFSAGTCTWTRKDPAASPAGRDRYGMAYDSWNGRTVVYGGASRITTEFDTWAYDAGSDSWEDLTPRTAPYPRSHHSMVYDERNRATILFGGLDGLNDTWTYRAGDNEWTEMKPSSPPRARTMQAMAYDSDRGVAVLYGGWSRSAIGYAHEVQNDTWTYDLAQNSWEQVDIPGNRTPPGVRSHAMVYDSKNEVMVAFGGVGQVLGGGELGSNETWLYYPESRTWVNASPAGSPPPRVEHSMVFDEGSGLVVLFGGISWSDMQAFNDTWTYSTALNEWTRRAQSGAPQPNPDYSMAYLAPLGEVMVFGGGHHDAALNATWLYNASRNSWRRITPDAAPPARYGQAMVYDSGAAVCVLFSGAIPRDFCHRMDVWLFGAMAGGGTFTSRPFDTGGIAFFGSIAWNATVPDGASLLFRTRAADTLENLTGLPFTGPDGSDESFYDRSGQPMSGGANGSRWIQYRASFNSLNDATPVLRSVDIDYNLVHQLRVLAPAGGENWSGARNITWSASDPDDDNLSFDLFLENATGSLPLVSGLPDGTSSWHWDTSTVPNGTYRIRIAAIDDNPSIPLTVDATSPDFTLFHPPPNLPPTISLLSPPNNSVVDSRSVRFTWNGSDPEGDALFYMLVLERPGLDPFDNPPYITTEESLEVIDLKDNRTYHWTVRVAEKSNPENAVASEKWSFTVSLPPPPVNHPPRITSIPKTTVTAGETYQYNVTAIDEDFDILRYSLVTAPQNMSIDSTTGRLRWPTTASDVGNHTITVRVTDIVHATDNQTFTVAVLEPPAPPPQKPRCSISSPADGSRVFGRIEIKGTAANGTLPITVVQVRLDGGEWQTAVGLGNWSLALDLSRTPNGRHNIEARSFDGSLYSDTAAVQVDVRNPEPGTSVLGPPWLLFVLIIIALAAAGIFLAARSRRKE